ncbi:RF-1 domain-containing protein [Lactarius akahatsu]|uniref:RF-1 domain-containing protein n=1 Tax=Lactarius akahatsu TaxID=416441 RepID=A0AAD4LTF0_9AGAM|nr:RF-1 domain-containing protein [Lactarius akahatsu]
MSTTIPPPLRAAARSVYRDLWRASSTTFSGDPPVLSAFRQKIRKDALDQRATKDEEVFRNNLNIGREIAVFLRKNIVQAERLQGIPGEDDMETYKIRITKHTELGDNSTIKDPENMVEMPRRQRRKEKVASEDTEPWGDGAPFSVAPRFYSQMKRAHKERAMPVINEDDIEESFVRGGGPGGQSINKTKNNVQLLHKPTGIRVSCQETRSLEQNRKFARRILLDKLDKISNPGLSKSEIQKAKHLERERRRRKKAKKKAATRQAGEAHVSCGTTSPY